MLPRRYHPTMIKLRSMFEKGAELATQDAPKLLYIDERNVREYMKILKAEDFIYIKSWRRTTHEGSQWIPVYSLKRDEDDRDVPRPSKLSGAQIRARYRARGDNWQKDLARDRRRLMAKKFVAEGVTLDPLMAAFNRDATMNV